VSAPEPSAPVLGRLDPHATTGFARDSMIRQVSAELCIGLVVQRALTLEVGHSKVGAGVQEHSLFRQQPLRRLWSTADTALRLLWGDPAVARAAAQQVYSLHDHINGELPEPSAAWPQGDRYTAHDSSLLLWVWATLVDTSLVAYERWLRPLSEAEADAYYADMCTFASFFGIPAAIVPPDRAAFAAYYETVLAGDELQPTPTSLSMVRDVLWFRAWNVPAPAVRRLRVLSIGLLDPRIVERFGLTLSARDQRLFDRLDGLLRRVYRHRPGWLIHRLPELYVALRTPTVGLSKRLGR
jgi:uncharacterized protein (DUF2236 family)